MKKNQNIITITEIIKEKTKFEAQVRIWVSAVFEKYIIRTRTIPKTTLLSRDLFLYFDRFNLLLFWEIILFKPSFPCLKALELVILKIRGVTHPFFQLFIQM